jgi:hypothetical protein
MKFGTLEYDLMNKKEPYKRMSFKKKKKFVDNKSKISDNGSKKSNETLVNKDVTIFGPLLPENWVRPSSLTGDKSIDNTAQEIENKLKRTIVNIFHSYITSHK